VAVARGEKRASGMIGEGLGLGQVRKSKIILRVLNIELLKAARTCSSWIKGGVGMEDEYR